MAISWVANGTAFNRITSGTGWTWNKPGGSTTTGDLMIASVVWDPNLSQDTYTLPTGWTLIKNVYQSNGSVAIQMVVAYRFVEAGDPSSWAGTLSASAETCAAAVSAYRGVQSIGNSSSAGANSTTSFSTGSATSPATAGPWRMTVGAYTSGSASYTIDSSEFARRITYTADDSGDTGALQGGIWDSDGTVSSSTSYSRTVSRSAAWSAAVGTVFYLAQSIGTPATGTLTGALGNVEAVSDGEVHNDGVVAASVPKLAALADGYGQPPVVTGTMASAVPLVSATAEGNIPVFGPLTAMLPLSVEFTAETRSFGVRVINVEADNRTIRVESRGVAD